MTLHGKSLIHTARKKYQDYQETCHVLQGLPQSSCHSPGPCRAECTNSLREEVSVRNVGDRLGLSQRNQYYVDLRRCNVTSKITLQIRSDTDGQAMSSHPHGTGNDDRSSSIWNHEIIEALLINFIRTWWVLQLWNQTWETYFRKFYTHQKQLNTQSLMYSQRPEGCCFFGFLLSQRRWSLLG
jgi:hypothetical protein